MAALPRLLILPDAARVEQWLVDETQRQDAVDLRGVCTFASLVERCVPGARVADALLQQLMLGRVMRSAGQQARSPAFVGEFFSLIEHWRAQAATPSLLELAAKQVTSLPLRERALQWASWWRALDAELASLGRVASGELLRGATQKLDEHGLPLSLRSFRLLEVQHLHDVFPARLHFLRALAQACETAEVQFVWRWPSAGHVAVDAFVVNAIRDVEATWQHLSAEVVPDCAERPLSWVAGALFTESQQRHAAPTLRAFGAASPKDEARELAKQVCQVLAQGVAPESVAIAFRDVGTDAEMVAQALDALGIPARLRRGQSLTQTPRGRLALSLLELEGEGFPAEKMASLLDVAKPTASLERRRVFRAAGVRDNLLGAVGTSGAYAMRLSALAERVRGEKSEVLQLLDDAQWLMALCSRIPAEGPAFELWVAWKRALTEAGLLRMGPAREGFDCSSVFSREADAAAAWEQRSVEAMERLILVLRDDLELSGLGRRSMTRAEFAKWLRLAAASVGVSLPTTRAGAVWILDVDELPGRRFSHLFLGGLLDGRFPGRASALPLLNDEERAALSRAARWPLFRSTVGEGDVQLPARLAEDRLLLHLALSCADRVTLSRARFDASGKELLASPFWEGLARSIDGWHEDVIHRSAAPVWNAVQHEREFRVRAALELGVGVEEARTAAWARVLAAEPWYRRATHVARMERERFFFFADERRAPGPWSGQLTGPLLDVLQPRLDFDSTHPVSAHELGEWGNCAFRGLALRVVGLSAAETAGEEPDARARGTFWHEALALAVPRLVEAKLWGQWPISEAARAIVVAAIDESANAISGRAAIGHLELWTLAREKAVTVLEKALEEPLVAPFVAAHPRHFEVPFGEPTSPAALAHVQIPAAHASERDVYLRGRIDRVDVGQSTLGVIDYKTNVSRTLSRDFLHQEFQMAVYLLAARQLAPQASLSGVWLGLSRRELRNIDSVLKPGTVDSLLATDELGRARAHREQHPNLASAVHGLLGELRAGHMGPRPLDCAMCELQAVCRISQRASSEDAA